MCITQSHTAFRWICPYLQLPVTQQHNESNCEGSVTDAQQQNHTESKSGLNCVHSLTCSHFVTRQTFFVLIWHAVSFLVRRWNVSAAASQTLNCQLLLVGCKFRFQRIFHRKVKFLWFQCCLHASQTCFNVQPSSSSSQSSDSVTCPLERHSAAPVLSWCTRVDIATEVSLFLFSCLCYFFTFDFNLDLFLFSSCRTHFHSSVKLLLCCVHHLLSFTVWGSTRLCSYPLLMQSKQRMNLPASQLLHICMF